MGEAVFREIISKLHALFNTKSVSNMQQVHTNSALDGSHPVDYQFGMSTLKDLRERKGLSQAKLASLAGTSQPQIKRLEDGSRELTVAWAERLAPHLGVTAEQLLFPGRPAAVGGGSLEPDVDLSKADPAPPLHRFGGPRDVPVLGTAVGGGDEDGDFRFNGETIDYAPRPPGIANRKDVYCLYVENDSMYPRFDPGVRLYVDPHRPARAGDDVVVELVGAGEGEPGKGFIKRLVRKTPGRVILEQFNPPKQLEFDAQEVKSLHRVIPYDELLGV